jgi:hypothetical protein
MFAKHRIWLKGPVEWADPNFVFVSIITHCKMMHEKQTAVSRYGPPGFVDTEDQEKGTWPFQAVDRLAANNTTRKAYLLVMQRKCHNRSRSGNRCQK